VASDVGVAAQLIHAAIKSCRYNLWINLNYIQDKQFKLDVQQQAKRLLDTSKDRRDQIHRQIKALLKK
jgi:formiminotetrahydrofolate cyclodeaminase